MLEIASPSENYDQYITTNEVEFVGYLPVNPTRVNYSVYGQYTGSNVLTPGSYGYFIPSYDANVWNIDTKENLYRVVSTTTYGFRQGSGGAMEEKFSDPIWVLVQG